jgi:hypothetical protein
VIPLTYILINLIHALWHCYLIKKNRLIQSGQKVIEYSVLSIVAALIILWVKGSFKYGSWLTDSLPLIFFCLLSRLALFDPVLNLLRGKPIYYEGTIDRKKSGFDWLESKLPVPIWLLRLIYIAAFITYLIIYLL